MGEFNEIQAAELIKKFKLSDKTLAVWKSRGSIPEKYLNPDFQVVAPVADVRILDKIKAILDSEKINVAAFAKHSGLNPAKLSDFKRGKSALNEAEVKLFRKHLNQIRISATKLINEANERTNIRDTTSEKIKDFLKKNPELVIMKVFEHKKLIDWRNGKPVAMTFDDYRVIKDRLAIFCLETQI